MFWNGTVPLRKLPLMSISTFLVISIKASHSFVVKALADHDRARGNLSASLFKEIGIEIALVSRQEYLRCFTEERFLIWN